MTRILKRKDFAHWQASEKLSDTALCKAVYAGKALLELAGEALSKALQSSVLVEVHREQDH